MSTEAAFHRAILANPADVSLRLVFADWLEEQGDPRAELFRLQHALTQSTDVPNRHVLEARQQKLLEAGVPPAAIAAENSLGMKFSLIPPGEFRMGSSDADIDAIVRKHRNQMNRTWFADEQPQHAVRITHPFLLGVFPVTQGEFQQVMGWNRSYFRDGDFGESALAGICDTSRFPVDGVSWCDALAYCNRLSEIEQRAPYYELRDLLILNKPAIARAKVTVLGGDGYRLPSEAEWEYACRAGTTTPFHFGSQLNGLEANVDGEQPFGVREKGPALKRTTAVGSYAGNPWGLYDMHGNVWEWCQDEWRQDYYRESPREDPPGPEFDFNRVMRGGSWADAAWCARSAHRKKYPLYGGTNGTFGCRIARTL